MNNKNKNMLKLWTTTDRRKVKSILSHIERGYFYVVRISPDYEYPASEWDFVRLYSPSGEYIGTVPLVAGIRSTGTDFDKSTHVFLDKLLLSMGWKAVEFRRVGKIITDPSTDPSKNWDGGDYDMGWEIYYSPLIGYIAQYNRMLGSAFHSEGWDGRPKVFKSWADLVYALDEPGVEWDIDWLPPHP